MKPAVAVGQKLWFIGNYQYKNGVDVIVEKIGHRWITVNKEPGVEWSKWQIDKHSWGSHEKSPNGRVYTSKEEYEMGVLLKETWSDFYSRLTYSYPPDKITLQRIRELAEEFDIPLKGK